MANRRSKFLGQGGVLVDARFHCNESRPDPGSETFKGQSAVSIGSSQKEYWLQGNEWNVGGDTVGVGGLVEDASVMARRGEDNEIVRRAKWMGQ